MSDATPSLSDQALENLVNQFARPLDLLRELVQNSIDAGSPRVDVWVGWDPPQDGDVGILRVGVDDYGEGMDEAIINDQLLSLYASSKEDDLTKIGKFGIGFTSIFAIQPDRVLLHTGRHGQYWELMAGPDRVWEKHRSTEPVTGTRITLFKLTPTDRVDAFVEEAREVLTYWCEHSSVPITFEDRRQAVAAPADTADPFAAFSDADHDGGPRAVNGPLGLQGMLVHHSTEPGTEVFVGYADAPRYGFYNGGLTLLNTRNEDALGPFRDRLAHLSFKVKNDHLEHTLTRDNVLQDDAWRETMNRVVRAHNGLRDLLVARCETAVADGEPLDAWHAALAAECSAPGSRFVDSLDDRQLFRTVLGKPVTLAQIRAQEGNVGHVLLGQGDTPLHRALLSLGIDVIEVSPGTRLALTNTRKPPMIAWLQRQRTLRDAAEVFVLPDPVDEASLPAGERELLSRTRELLASAVGLRVSLPMTSQALTWAPAAGSHANRLTLVVGNFRGPELGAADPLALNGPGDGRVFARPTADWSLRMPAFLHWRSLLVNRHQPLFRTHVLAASEDVELAALALAQALLHAEGIEGPSAYRRVLETSFEETHP